MRSWRRIRGAGVEDFLVTEGSRTRPQFEAPSINSVDQEVYGDTVRTTFSATIVIWTVVMVIGQTEWL